jgi:hypothetical protein
MVTAVIFFLNQWSSWIAKVFVSCQPEAYVVNFDQFATSLTLDTERGKLTDETPHR